MPIEVRRTLVIPMEDGCWSIRMEVTSRTEVDVGMYWKDKIYPSHAVTIPKADLKELLK